MLVYQLQERVFDLPRGARFEFPNKVVAEVELTPEVPFGGVSGPSRHVVADSKISIRMNQSTGRVAAERIDHPLFYALDASIDVADTHFEIK